MAGMTDIGPVADLAYGTNPGCVARVNTPGGTPGQCGALEAAAVPHRYKFPRPHATRLYVCEYHAEGLDGAEPLNEADRRIIAERWERRRAQLQRAGRDVTAPGRPAI